MNKADAAMLANSWFNFPWNAPKEESIDTLNAFVRDSEHEIMAVLTALQAQLDLLQNEQVVNNLPVTRFPPMNQAISRLIANTYALSFISELATTPRSTTKVSLAVLFEDVLAETEGSFGPGQVSVTCSIPEGTIIEGEVSSLKQMCEGILIIVMHKCLPSDSIRIVVLPQKKCVSIVYEIGGIKIEESDFIPWRTGQLKYVPTNGDGIKLSAIDAMAHLHQGRLEVSRMPDDRDTYRLVFNS